eukprot:COSAG05_NODE_1087_length_5921_cov_15.803332_1_plen_1334_part_10
MLQAKKAAPSVQLQPRGAPAEAGKNFKLSKSKKIRGFKGPAVPSAEDRLFSEDGDDDEGGSVISASDRELQLVRSDLAALQRSLNSAAKDNNAIGISQCIQLQDGLGLHLLGDEHLDLGTALCLAARRGNLEALAALISKGSNLEFAQATEKGFRALHWAARFNRADAARVLINAGADIHAPSESGQPLTIGVAQGAHEVVWELLRVDRCDKRVGESATDTGKLVPPSAEQVAAFHTAVLRGDRPMVRQFVKAGIPIDVPNHNGWTGIHIAALHNYRDLVRLLADSAAKLNLSEPQTGMTPLVVAAKQGYVKIVSLLLDYGVELDGADSNGVTALQSACSQGRFDIVGMLLESGASCDKVTNAGDTALMTAIKANFQDIVSRLIRHPELDCESIGQRCPIGPGGVMWSPMQVAARCGFGSVVEVLWKMGRADVNRQLRDHHGLTWTTLSIASCRNNLDAVKILLRARAQVFPVNEDGRQAVWFAARDGYADVVAALLEGGGNAGLADVDGLTPALAAALYGHVDTIKLILRWQISEVRQVAEIDELRIEAGNDQEEDDETLALEQLSVQKLGKDQILAKSVSKRDLAPGAVGPSARAGLGLILRAAIIRNDLELLEMALRLGADPESEEDQYRKCSGQWAVELAAQRNHMDVLLRVARTGASLWHRMSRSEEPDQFRDVAAYTYALQSRIRPEEDQGEQENHDDEKPSGLDATGRPLGFEAGIDARPGLAQELDSEVDPLARTPLIYACDMGSMQWITDLLKCGANISAVDADGWTVVHAAAFNGRLDILNHILPLAKKAGLNINAPGKDGRTPLDLAKNGRYQPDPAVATLLRDFGASAPSKKKARKEASKRRCTLCLRLPLAAVHAAFAIAVLLWQSVSLYEVVWQIHHVDLSPFRRSSRGMYWPRVPLFCAMLACYMGGIPWIMSKMPSPILSQLGSVPVMAALLGSQLVAVVRALHFDPGAVGCRRIPATASSWRSRRELMALVLEFLQHISVSFAAEVYWNPDSQVDAASQLTSLTARRWLGEPPLPGLIVFGVAVFLAFLWLCLAGYLALSVRVIFDEPLRAQLPALRADQGKSPVAEGPMPLLLGTTAYMAVVAGLLRQLHCAPADIPIESLRIASPDTSVLPMLWDDAPTVQTVCWTSALHVFRAELAMVILLFYQLTTCTLAPFFSQSREPTERLLGDGKGPGLTVQPGIRRSFRFDAVARLVKLVLAIVATYGRAQSSLVLAVSLGCNGLLAILAHTSWCRPTNHAFLNVLWSGCYGAAAWAAMVSWLSYIVAAPSTWGTVGVLLVGWVFGGVRIFAVCKGDNVMSADAEVAPPPLQSGSARPS